eukprot:TRINITY_DN11872_c0_g1_i1.p1 TRINITY_DN11872_c0_g1~~TRINITY_DN11872_c0_g1_i1.p1  ORF type:complete len:1388 (+),score=341.30 TRINITY_DN11872_c0_g1_i1:151-4314(+)
MGVFDFNQQVWVQHPIGSSSNAWHLGNVVSQGSTGVTVKLTETRNEVTVPESSVVPTHPDHLKVVDDMVAMGDLHEAAILHNVKQRYQKDTIYTYIGPVVISLNPFKAIPNLYNTQTIDQYRNPDSIPSAPPHIFAVASKALSNLVKGGRSQSILINGESGSGKTEATKSILSCLASLVAGKGQIGKIETMIIESNPVLEAFGNARTVRNNNSSRFGKFIKVIFDSRGLIIGANIDTYLLEKLRIAYQAPSERNYHIFYQLCAGATKEEKTSLNLLPIDQYHYLNQSKCFSIPGVDDAKEFHRVRHALTTVGISKENQSCLLKVLSCILLLGNIKFKANQKEEAALDNLPMVDTVANMLRLSTQEMEGVLVTRSFRGAKRVSSYSIPLTVAQAIESRDALAKDLYSRIFLWLVNQINNHLASQCKGQEISDNQMVIGVLDIFGFEIFENNSFEQFLINFANEKLHSQFNNYMFKMEQDQYQKEGIPWSSIEFADNIECIELIESRTSFGILSMLDEECNIPKGSEDGLMQKLLQKHSQHKYFKKIAKATNNQFGIKHYAGEVTYSIVGFMDKNKDNLLSDLEETFKQSENKFIQELFELQAKAIPSVAARAESNVVKPAGRGIPPNRGAFATMGKGGVDRSSDEGQKKKASVGTQFRAQLNELSRILASTDPHYIRCIKPCTESKPNAFNAAYVLNQMRCAGILETVKIRKAGFASRSTFEQFYYRYRVLSNQKPSTDFKSLATAILRANSLEHQWVMGKTQVMLKTKQLEKLERLREEKLKQFARKIWRFYCKYKQIKQARALLRKLKEEKRKKEEERRRQEEEKRRQEAERRRQEEERRRQEEERRKKEAADKARREEEERKKQAERAKKEAEDRVTTGVRSPPRSPPLSPTQTTQNKSRPLPQVPGAPSSNSNEKSSAAWTAFSQVNRSNSPTFRGKVGSSYVTSTSSVSNSNGNGCLESNSSSSSSCESKSPVVDETESLWERHTTPTRAHNRRHSLIAGKQRTIIMGVKRDKTMIRFSIEGSKRGHVLAEILATEKDYVGDLKLIVDVYLHPLQQNKILEPAQVATIFGNVETLLGVNTQLLASLESRIVESNGGSQVIMGDIFLSMSHYLKMYSAYCANQPRALACLEECKQNKEFVAFLEKGQQHPKSRGLNLFSFLIAPVQRICKYPLLFRDLLRNTADDHPDFAPVTSALTQIEAVVDYVNEAKRTAEQLQKIVDIQSCIEGVDDLVEPGRRFIREGKLSTCVLSEGEKKLEQSIVFMFNDLLIITRKIQKLIPASMLELTVVKDLGIKQKKTKPFEIKGRIPLAAVKVIVHSDNEQFKHVFQLNYLAQNYMLMAKSEEEVKDWVKDIKAITKEFQKKRLQNMKVEREKSEARAKREK